MSSALTCRCFSRSPMPRGWGDSAERRLSLERTKYVQQQGGFDEHAYDMYSIVALALMGEGLAWDLQVSVFSERGVPGCGPGPVVE